MPRAVFGEIVDRRDERARSPGATTPSMTACGVRDNAAYTATGRRKVRSAVRENIPS